MNFFEKMKDFECTLISIFEEEMRIDELAKSQKIPSPWTGEGWGEGEEWRYFRSLIIPIPFFPTHQGRGNLLFTKPSELVF